MRLFIALFLGVLATNASMAGDSLLVAKDSVIYKKALIIPFSTKLYLSDTDKDILEASKISFAELVNRYQEGICRELSHKMKNCVVSYVRPGIKDAGNEFKIISSGLGCSYETVPVIADKNKASKERSLFAKNESEPLKNGQLTDQPNLREDKYMATVFTSNKLFPYLIENYHPDLLVFINEFEIKNDVSDFASLGSETSKRKIRVHYTIFDKDQNRVCSNRVEHEFSSKENNVEKIIAGNFPELSQKIASCLPIIMPVIIKLKK